MDALNDASRQWMTRPADQRFCSLLELQTAVQAHRKNSAARTVSSRTIKAAPIDGDNKALAVVGPNGGAVNLTHWSFGQLAARAGAPAGYLRSLPGPMAADCLNFGLQTRDIEDVGVLLYKNGGAPEMRAVTGPNYGRIWNSTIVDGLVGRFGDGVTGAFRVPGEFGKKVAITKANTTIYASDRDMFVFLADETNRIEIPNRRNGEAGTLARGFFVWNSEVGAATFGVKTFLFDYVCCNRIVWGASDVKTIKIRHTASAPTRWVDEVAPALEDYAQSSTRSITEAIDMARAKRIDDVDAFLTARFTRSETVAIKAAHLEDEARPIETLWDAATGVTAYARSIQWQDERVKVEEKAGMILDIAC